MITNSFHDSEKELGLIFLPQFYEFLNQLIILSTKPKFDHLFRNAHFCTIDEIRYALENYISDGFIPFFIEQNATQIDYYCFNNLGASGANTIIVFSGGSIVADWPDYPAFLAWIEEKIK